MINTIRNLLNKLRFTPPNNASPALDEIAKLHERLSQVRYEASIDTERAIAELDERLSDFLEKEVVSKLNSMDKKWSTLELKVLETQLMVDNLRKASKRTRTQDLIADYILGRGGVNPADILKPH
jgi:predicted component of type VI protein secretion system